MHISPPSIGAPLIVAPLIVALLFVAPQSVDRGQDHSGSIYGVSIINNMISVHPEPRSFPEVVSACIQACVDCAQACTSCADACLAEQDPAALTRCIRKNLDCADLAATVARVLLRNAGYSSEVTAALLTACRALCGVAGAECQRHATTYSHCRICAEACWECERACANLLRTLS